MRIVMDDAGDVPAELIEKYNIRVLPVNIAFGTEQYLSTVDMDHASFYEKTGHITADNFPKTSQPTPFQFIECFKQILEEGENEILAITVGQKLSGTYSSAVQAAKELDGQGTFHLFDSQGATALQGFMAIEAARMAGDGANIQDIITRLEKLRSDMVVYFTIDSLEYAVKGGRIGPMRSIMASLLNIKPIMRLVDGEVVEAGRVRTRRKALAHIVQVVYEAVGDRPVKMAIIHANSPKDAAELRSQANAVLNATEEITVDMAVPVAINLGPGALGLVAIPE